MVMPSEETEAQRGKVIGSRPHSFQVAELRYAGGLRAWPLSAVPCCAPSPPPQLIQAPPAPPRGLVGKSTVPVVLSPGFESSLQCQLAEGL